MAHKLPHYTETVRFYHFLHRCTDIAQRRSRPDYRVTSNRRLAFGVTSAPTGTVIAESP
jgi:hypothetical protein